MNASEIGFRVYTSRLLGRDKTLVLHGGGNTSVKLFQKNIFGEDEEILFVKGSGWDLEKIEEDGFSPVRLKHLRQLAHPKAISDPEMVNELLTNMTRSSAPIPSVEAILHAILPYKYVDHTHADAVVTVTTSVKGERRIREIYGDSVVVIPYVKPGFELARMCMTEYKRQASAKTIGMVLLNHDIFSFGGTANESYERMVDLVGIAKEYIDRKNAWNIEWGEHENSYEDMALDLASLRSEISSIAGFPMVMTRHADV